LKLSENKISGMLLSSERRTLKTLITTMPMVEIPSYFSVSKLLPELSWVANAAVNATNAEKVQAMQASLENSIFNSPISAPFTLTFAVLGKPKFDDSSNLTPQLKYDSSNAYIVANVLGLVAMCKALGIKTFLFSSRLSVKEANSKSELRQRLAMESVEVRIIFDDQRGLTSDDVTELFKQFQTIDTSMNLPHQIDRKGLISEDNYPLKTFVDKLVVEAKIDSYGGIKRDAKHVKVSECYITTSYVLFKLIVGAVAGVGTQEYGKMSKDITLPTGVCLSSILSSGYIDFVIAFVKGWLEPQKEAFVRNRNGYHLSPQVWQALGLVIHQLVSDGILKEQLKLMGKALGQLDYSKNASHWGKCSVMELDSRGRLYKNSANSTRQFRVGLFKYFITVLKVDSGLKN